MKKSLVYLTLVLSTLFWGANFNLGKYVVHAMDPPAAAAWRFITAGAVMAAYTFYKEGIDWAGMRRNLAPLVVMALLGIFGFNVAFFYGLQTTSSVDGSLIMTLSVISIHSRLGSTPDRASASLTTAGRLGSAS